MESLGQDMKILDMVKTAEGIVKTALEKVSINHVNLGEKGKTIIKKNQFGDTALRADIEAEKVIIDYLHEIEFPTRIISEEHGIDDSLYKKPIFLVIIDGIDGTKAYKKRLGQYGTIFAIYDGLEPHYDEYLASGIIEHITRRLFIASKGNGAFAIDLKLKKRKPMPIHCSRANQLTRDTKIHIDEAWKINREVFSKNLTNFQTSDLYSTAAHYVNLIIGNTDAVLECTRKLNLEIAGAYGLMREAGVETVDLNGNNIANKIYVEWGQDRHIPVISAATYGLSRSLIGHIKKQPVSGCL